MIRQKNILTKKEHVLVDDKCPPPFNGCDRCRKESFLHWFDCFYDEEEDLTTLHTKNIK